MSEDLLEQQNIGIKGEKLLKYLEKPWRIYRNSGAIGLEMVRAKIRTVFFIATINLILWVIGFYRLISDFSSLRTFTFLLETIVGIGFVFYVVRRFYKNIQLDIMKLLYNVVSNHLLNICTTMADQLKKNISNATNTVTIEKLTDRLELIKNIDAENSITFKKILQKIPIKAPLNQILKEVNKEIEDLDKNDLGKLIYDKLDSHMKTYIFSHDDARWVKWTFIINILISIFLIV